MRSFFLSVFILFGFNIALLSSTRIDFFFITSDGTRLDCTKFIPDGTPPQNGWACVIICHGYGLTKYSEMDAAEEYADSGYYSLVYSMRGQGISTGLSNLISTTEMNDLIQIVNYVKNEPTSNDNRIGIMGGSQGGIIPFMSVCNGLNVRAVISDFASPEFATSWMENGSIKMTLLWTVSYDTSIARYNAQVSRYRSWILSSQKDKWDSLAYYMPLNRDFYNVVQNCQVPIMFQNTWQDKFFNTYGIIRSIYLLPFNNIKTYFGAMDGHGSDYYNPEIIYQKQTIWEWWRYWLKDIPNSVMDAGKKFTYACSKYPVSNNGGWTFQRFQTSVWPPSDVQNVRLYFHPDNKIVPYYYSGSQTDVSFLNDVRDSTLTMLEAVNLAFTGNQFNAKFQKQVIQYDTPALLQNATLLGTPAVGLFYSSTADICQYNFQIYEVNTNGQERFVTRVNWTDRYYTPNTLKSQYVPGLSHGHIFQAGNKIRVKVTNLDTGYPNDTAFLHTNPHVLPVLKRATNKIYVNNASRTYIDLPMINFVIGINNITEVIPENFRLYQNYPNPFNPITKIRFDIPSNGRSKTANVKITIYDIIGREILTLVNQNLQPGTYEVEFNGSGYPSGLYFCRMVADSYGEAEGFSQTHKLILLK